MYIDVIDLWECWATILSTDFFYIAKATLEGYTHVQLLTQGNAT